MGGAFTSTMLTLVIGGARSGKSRFAQSLAADSASVAYIATARAEDAEMAARIARHRADRPPHWTTIEAPLDIANAVEQHARDFDTILLDCLTLWLSNLCFEHRDRPRLSIHAAASQQLTRLADAARLTHLVLVTNEVGSGLVPESSLGRFFRDLQGSINQEAARAADWVHHLVAGIPVAIKQPGARP